MCRESYLKKEQSSYLLDWKGGKQPHTTFDFVTPVSLLPHLVQFGLITDTSIEITNISLQTFEMGLDLSQSSHCLMLWETFCRQLGTLSERVGGLHANFCISQFKQRCVCLIRQNKIRRVIASFNAFIRAPVWKCS